MTKLRQQFRNILREAGLLPGETERESSSSQRAVRHGEVQHLRSLKRDFIRSGQKKRKVLKLCDDVEDLDEDDADADAEPAAGTDNIDIRDVEFRLQHDSSKVRSLLSSVSTTSFHDLMLLKLILSCGLSPQVALADEFNNYKSTSEQLFHTRAKPFTILHPMGVFANHPEVLQLQDHETVDVPGTEQRRLATLVTTCASQGFVMRSCDAASFLRHCVRVTPLPTCWGGILIFIYFK